MHQGGGCDGLLPVPPPGPLHYQREAPPLRDTLGQHQCRQITPLLREAAKKSSLFSGPTTKAFTRDSSVLIHLNPGHYVLSCPVSPSLGTYFSTATNKKKMF